MRHTACGDRSVATARAVRRGANQGVGVDAEYFYAVTNREIGKYDKETGELVDAWIDVDGGPAIHFDSAVIVDGLLYASLAVFAAVSAFAFVAARPAAAAALFALSLGMVLLSAVLGARLARSAPPCWEDLTQDAH